MLRAIATQTLLDLATAFGYSTPTDAGRDDAPRDVLWGPSEIALRRRQEQSSRLERPPEQNMPFMSFWRVGAELNKQRFNTPLARVGAITGSSRARKYEMRPVDVLFQVDHWASKHVNHETAIENYFKWSAPPTQMSLTDTEGVVFRLPMWFEGASDNSRIMEVYDIGELYRWTFTFRVGGYVVHGDTEFNTIDSIRIRFLDYSATGETTDAVLIKQVELTE